MLMVMLMVYVVVVLCVDGRREVGEKFDGRGEVALGAPDPSPPLPLRSSRSYRLLP